MTGSAVTGTITKQGDGPIEGASVQLRNPSTGDTFVAVTGKSGQFFIDNVPAGGPYVLTASAEGLQTAAEPDIQLTLGQRLTVNLALRTQFVEEIAVVAHRDTNADKGRTGPSTVVRGTTITELPLQGRNFTDLISTDPRVSGNSIAGQNNRFNNIQIDGGANNDLFGLAASGTPGGQANAKPLSIEAIKEFVVQVAPFDVRQGSFAGGLVNAITKSGTNEFHGSVFGYWQNKSLANQKYYKAPGVYVDDPNFNSYNTVQFGAAVGGPIIKDKAHFFIAADLQQKQSSFGSSANLGATPGPGFDAATVQRFLDTLKNKYNISNVGDASAPDLGNPDANLFVKVDTSAIENSHLELSYNFVKATQDVLIRNPTAPSIPSRLRDGYELSNSGYGQANTTNTVRAKMTTNWLEGRLSNEFLGGVSFIRDERALPNNVPLILVDATCPRGTVSTPDKPCGTGLGSSNTWIAAGEERFSQANILDQDIYQLQDNLTLAQESHRITFGTSNEFFKFRNVFLQAADGVWAFNSLDDFEAGNAAAFQRRISVSPLQEPGTAKFSVAQLGFYVQDEWSVLDNFSLQPGLRMDVPFLSKANTNPVLLNAGLPIDTGRVPTGNILWSPRLGFNWDVEGNSDTVVRGGAGVFSGRPPYVWLSNAYSVNGLSQLEFTCTGANVPVFNPDRTQQPTQCLNQPAPSASSNQGEIDYFDPDTKYPQNLRVALGADRRLPFGIVGSADFLYTQDINGWYTTDKNLSYQGNNGENRATYGTFAPTGSFRATPSRVDGKSLTQAVEVYNLNGGKVTSATIQLRKQFARRYEISVAYTYSRSYDRISFTSSQAFSNFQFAPVDGDLNSRNVRPSAFDRPHKITVTGTAQLPYGFGIGISYVGQSGLPYTWTVSGDVNADGVNGNDIAFIPADRSQISLSGNQAAQDKQWNDLSTFINSHSCLKDAKGGFVQRGACRNPWQDFVDMRLTWTSPRFYADHRIEVQWDIFNVLNLLNSRWGHFLQDAQFENAPSSFLSAVGYDAAHNRPVYSVRLPSTITSAVYSPTLSRWRMQIGARYVF